MQQEFTSTYLPWLFYIHRMSVIILPLSHSYMDFHLVFGDFIPKNTIYQIDGVDGYLRSKDF